jgi:tRNA threonylcarbamoyl adenosine modification protein YeaZ
LLILALDSSLGPGRVAIIDVTADHACPLAERSDPDPKGMAERLVAMVGAALTDAGCSLSAINRIAVTTGPGGFTSVRIALAAAQGLSLSRTIPLVGVSTLDVLAQGASAQTDIVLAAIPVGRGEIAVQAFDRDRAVTLDLFVGASQDYDALLPRANFAVCGPAADAPVFAHAVEISLAGPDMGALALLASRLTPGSADASYQPLYARPPDAKLPDRPPSSDPALSSVPGTP